MKIRAAVARAREPFTLEECELAAPGAREVLVEVEACGICHTDLSAKDHGMGTPLPAVLGHEGVGRILSLGEGVEGFEVGDRVVMSFGACGLCPSCLQEMPAVSLEALYELFDSQEAIEPSFMLGDWEGGVFRTGHAGEQQLDVIKWVGKSFHSENDVDPIISRAADGGREVNPILGKATLRLVRYRGVSTATMVYDQHPVFDHFRKINDSLVLGVMDRKGEAFPLFFYLRRLSREVVR